jgi:hypothetical protein
MERGVMPIFSIITTDGRWYRSFIEEADAANGIWVTDPRTRDEDNLSYHDTDALIMVPWGEVSSITRDGESA